jgi:NAD(P)-dependent dehydrogenase (short-subunit alcohol dehydrogenase family)
MELLFEGKVALVTSDASAIGCAVAFSYADNGAFVIVSDIVDNETANKIKATGGNAVFIKSNVSKPHECKKLIEKIISIYGRIDIAFNNAGIVNDTIDLIDTYLAGILKLFAPKTNIAFYCMKYEIEAMRQQRKGVIINMSSLTGSVSLTSPRSDFSHKKGIASNQNETLKNSDKVIPINCIPYGFAEIPLPGSFHLESKEEGSLKSTEKETKTPEQIAELIMWLSSEKASFSTRACFPEYVGYVAN